jgi:hypothetical protein
MEAVKSGKADNPMGRAARMSMRMLARALGIYLVAGAAAAPTRQRLGLRKARIKKFLES